jgi:formiminotetrahydrofolate cyclodeaminase
MDDSAIKSPTSVALAHLESNAVHKKQLSLGGANAISIHASAASICAKVVSVAIDSYDPAKLVNLGPL